MTHIIRTPALVAMSFRYRQLKSVVTHCENMRGLCGGNGGANMYDRHRASAISEMSDIEKKHRQHSAAMAPIFAAVNPRLAAVMNELERSK